jgi:hypothetical protein
LVTLSVVGGEKYQKTEFTASGSVPKRRTEEHRLLMASFRIRRDFVKASSTTSPSASKVFYAGGGIATFLSSKRTIEAAAKHPSAQPALFDVEFIEQILDRL